MIKTVTAIIIIVLISALIAVFLYLQNNIIDITRYRLKDDKIKDRLRIVHLSDLHSKPMKKLLESIEMFLEEYYDSFAK